MVQLLVPVLCLAWSSDGQTLALGQSNGKVAMRDASGVTLATLDAVSCAPVTALSWAPQTPCACAFARSCAAACASARM